jgi:hypothetical protein
MRRVPRTNRRRIIESTFRVPDAVRHSSCRSAEPGPYQTQQSLTAPALQRHSASKTRVNALMAKRAALRPGHA